MSHGIDLCKTQCPSTQDERERMSKIPYASAKGSIMYAMICTRPDVACALSMTSRYQYDPGESHWTIIKNILKYLRILRINSQYMEELMSLFGGLEEFQEKHHSIVSMDANVVDPLTKPLLWPKYESHNAAMGIKYLKM